MAQTRKSTKKAPAKTKPSTAKKTPTAKKTSIAKAVAKADTEAGSTTATPAPERTSPKGAPTSVSTAAGKPVTKPAGKPISKPAGKPVSSPAAKSVPNPAAKSVPNPAAKPVTKPAAQAQAKPGKPEAKPAAAAAEHPDLTLARGLAEIISAYDLEELIYDTGELTLSLKRAGLRVAAAIEPAPAAGTVVLPAPAPVVAAPSSPARAPSSGARGASIIGAVQEPTSSLGQFRERSHLDAPDDEYHIIKSPFVGTFYRRPSPDADAYVTLGSRVAKGQVMCIIEAMKLMNEIESDASGTVADILVEDAQPVEYGQALFKLLVN